MKNKTMAALFIALVLSSCSKDDPQTLPITPSSNSTAYVQLQVGNYWVYQGFTQTPSSSVFTMNNLRDSVYISTDTIINGETYFILQGNHFGMPNYKRVARVIGSQLLDDSGNVLLDIDAISDTISVSQSSTFPIDSIAVVNQSGTRILDTSIGQLTSNHWQSRVLYVQSPFPSPQLEEELYVENIGLAIYSATFVSNGSQIEMRLADYSVQ